MWISVVLDFIAPADANVDSHLPELVVLRKLLFADLVNLRQ